jgi:UDP-glucose 4-epimerase
MAGRTAILGSSSFLGSRVLRRLLEGGDAAGLVAIDLSPPSPTLAGVRHRHIDLTEPASDEQLLDILRDEKIETLLHFAFFTNPRRDSTYAHELESIGTLSVFAAAAAAHVKHVVMRSFAAVYGARGQNPNFLTEDRPLYPSADLQWSRDKHEAEQHAASFAKRYPKMTVTVLRFATLFGPEVRTFYTSVFDKRVVPVPMGYNPLVQLLHPQDAVDAVEAALKHRPRGPVNVVPQGTLPLVSAIHLSDKIPLPVPHVAAYAIADALWSAGLADAPGGFVDYVRYLFVADGTRAKKEMGFEARYTTRDALEAYLGYRYPLRRRATLAVPA